MDRTELKFIELYFRITHNNNVISFEESMYPIISSTRGYENYLQNWENFLNNNRRKQGEHFDEWLDEINSIEDVARIDEITARSLPSKPIEITWGNDKDLALDIKRIFETFMQQARAICAPSMKNNFSAYYNIDATGYAMSIYSYDPSDKKTNNVKVRPIVIAAKKDLEKAVSKFNKLQGIGSQTDNLLLKEPFFSNSSTVKSYDSEINRGHIVDDDTAFEMSIFIDTYMVYREGKGSHVSDNEIIDFFSVLQPEYESVGPDA